MNKANDILNVTLEEIKVLEILIRGLYSKRRLLLKNRGEQSWWDYFMEWLGY